MRVLPIFLVGAASALRTTETCALKWVEGCVAGGASQRAIGAALSH
jgi:hypothetical protein